MFFDNTLQVKNFANSPEGQVILNTPAPRGNEKQLKNIGDKVNGNGYDNAKIIDIYKQNGFFYYVCEWKVKKNIYHETQRNKDILLYNKI